jgi:hypothetical protein
VRNCLSNSIDFQEYVLLYGLYHNNIDVFCEYNDAEPYTAYVLCNLINKGFLTKKTNHNLPTTIDDLHELNIKLTPRAEMIFKDSIKSAPSNEKLFPKGIKSGGFYVRSSIQDCSNKMYKFMNDNPTFTKEIILEATKNYIKDCEMRNYDKMKLAPYFINKDGTSMLSGYCEAYVQGINDNQDTYKISNDLEGV